MDIDATRRRSIENTPRGMPSVRSLIGPIVDLHAIQTQRDVLLLIVEYDLKEQRAMEMTQTALTWTVLQTTTFDDSIQ